MNTNRNFKFWYYRISHGELLVRSPKNSDLKTNVDIIVTGVQYVELPRILKNLEIYDPTNEDLLYLESKIGKIEDNVEIMVLRSEHKDFYIVAYDIRVQENEFDIFEIPFSKLEL